MVVSLPLSPDLTLPAKQGNMIPMYLKGSNWSMNRRRQSYNPWRIIILLALIGVFVYINQVVIPVTPPLFIPTPTPTRDPETYISEARALADQARYVQAVDAYKLAVQTNAQNPIPFIELARIQIYIGQYEEAEVNAANALLLSPNNSMAYALRGWALGMAGRYAEGIAALDSAIELDPNNAVAYAYLSEILIRQKQANLGDLNTLDRAIEASRKAEALAPESLETLRARGFVLFDTANYQEALEKFEKAVEINPNLFDLYLALGLSYRNTGDNGKAIQAFNKASTLNPTDPLSYTYISRTYLNEGELNRAIQFAQKAVEYDPEDPFLHGNLGYILFRNKQYLDAEPELRLAIQGGMTATGVEVKGMPLDYGRVAEFYAKFTITLARLNKCDEVVQLAQIIQLGIANDENAVYDANFALDICKENLKNPPKLPTAEPTATP